MYERVTENGLWSCTNIFIKSTTLFTRISYTKHTIETHCGERLLANQFNRIQKQINIKILSAFVFIGWTELRTLSRWLLLIFFLSLRSLMKWQNCHCKMSQRNKGCFERMILIWWSNNWLLLLINSLLKIRWTFFWAHGLEQQDQKNAQAFEVVLPFSALSF